MKRLIEKFPVKFSNNQLNNAHCLNLKQYTPQKKKQIFQIYLTMSHLIKKVFVTKMTFSCFMFKFCLTKKTEKKTQSFNQFKQKLDKQNTKLHQKIIRIMYLKNIVIIPNQHDL